MKSVSQNRFWILCSFVFILFGMAMIAAFLSLGDERATVYAAEDESIIVFMHGGNEVTDIVDSITIKKGDTFKFEKYVYVQNGDETVFTNSHLMDGCFYNSTRYNNPNEKICSFDGWMLDGVVIGDVETTWTQSVGTYYLYAKWTQVNYTCTLEYEADAVFAKPFDKGREFTYTYFSSIELPQMVRDGYRFRCWRDKTNAGMPVSNVKEHSGDMILYAEWDKLYTLTFYNEGRVQISTLEGIIGEQVTLPYYNGCPGGYKCLWNSKYAEGDSYVVKANEDFHPNIVEKTLEECFTGTHYEIYTYNQLNSIRNNKLWASSNSLGGEYLLCNDITVAKNWEPISKDFYGTFDGGNHTISNITMNVNTWGNFGFFRRVNRGHVKNVIFKNMKITTSYVSPSTDYEVNIGGIVGFLYEGRIENCELKGIDYTVDSYYGTSVGGIVGLAGYGKILNCKFTSGSIEGCAEATGGIVGFNGVNNRVENCQSTGTVNYFYDQGNGASGGIVGRNLGYIYDNSVDGYLNYVGDKSDSQAIQPYMGVVIGYNEKSGIYMREVDGKKVDANKWVSGKCDFTNLRSVGGGIFGIGAHNQKKYCKDASVGYAEN